VADSTPVYSTRLKAALIAAALFAMWNALETYQLQNAAPSLDPYLVADQPTRFAAVLAELPPTEIVGYVSDLDDGSPAALALFNSARFTFAPRLLVLSADRDWVLGNFSKPPDFAALARGRHLQLVRDFGNGVALFKRAP